MADSGKGKGTKAVVWVILLLLIVGLAGFGATNFGGATNTVGTVGKTPIDINRYSRMLNQELRALQAQTGSQMSFAQARQFGLDRLVLGRLVSDVALEDEVARIGFSVGDAEIGDNIRRIPAFQGLDGSFDRDAYEFALRNSGMTVAEFEEGMRSEIARTLLQSAGGATTPAPSAHMDVLFTYIGERRDATWAAVETDVLTTPVGEPTDAELTEFYEANPDDFTLPETRVITYAWLTPDMIVDTIEVDEDALRELYDARLSFYVRPERRLVERLVYGTEADALAAKARLDAGEAEFETLVDERNLTLEDIDLGDVTAEELGDAGPDVFAMEEPGVVGPVETSLGPALMRMNAILAAQETSFEDARDDLVRELAADRARRIIADQIDSIDDLLAGGATLEELGDETEMRVGQIDWTEGASEDIAAYDEFRDAAAAVAEGDFPEVAELEDGGIFALRLDEIRPPELQPLDAVREDAVFLWQDGTTARLLSEAAQGFADEIDGGADFESVSLTPTRELGVRRDSFVAGAPSGFNETLFDMAPGETQVVEGLGVAFVVRLDDVLPPDEMDSELTEQRDGLAASTAQSLGRDILDAFTAAVESNAGIELNQQAINAVHTQFP